MRKCLFLIVAALLICSACSTLTLESADFSWPIESVLPVNSNGNVMDQRHSVEFNTKPLFYEELTDSSAYSGKEIRLIRDQQGFYYVTANEFKNVYVFQAEEGELTLDNKIPISETGIVRPAFNQRGTYIELVDANNKALSLTHKGIEGEL
ncbi:MAG TPA: hypothetical protein VIY47_08915 [Ignavibacteriaceae bacterium]